eukprot:sb/3471010/
MATSAFVWTNYGLMKGDGTILFVNFIGCVLNCAYILLYYWYTPNKKVVYKTVGGFIGVLFLVHMYSNIYHANQDQAIEFFGLFGNVLAIAMFASPLAQLIMNWYGGSIAEAIKVIREKSTFLCVFVKDDKEASGGMMTALTENHQLFTNFISIQIEFGTISLPRPPLLSYQSLISISLTALSFSLPSLPLSF